MELTDIHNRRGNIGFVSKRCIENAYPLLAWPEDKQLLRLSDLPKLAHAGAFNQPVAWKRCTFRKVLIVRDDVDLQDAIESNRSVSNRAYAIVLNLGQFPGTMVAEYEVESV